MLCDSIQRAAAGASVLLLPPLDVCSLGSLRGGLLRVTTATQAMKILKPASAAARIHRRCVVSLPCMRLAREAEETEEPALVAAFTKLRREVANNAEPKLECLAIIGSGAHGWHDAPEPTHERDAVGTTAMTHAAFKPSDGISERPRARAQHMLLLALAATIQLISRPERRGARHFAAARITQRIRRFAEDAQTSTGRTERLQRFLWLVAVEYPVRDTMPNGMCSSGLTSTAYSTTASMHVERRRHRQASLRRRRYKASVPFGAVARDEVARCTRTKLRDSRLINRIPKRWAQKFAI